MSQQARLQHRFFAARRVIQVVNQVAEKCAGIFLMGMVAAVSISVASRMLYTYAGIAFSATWAEEVARYLMVGTVFVGGAVAAFGLRLIGVDAVLGLVSPAVGRWLRFTAHVLTTVFGALLVWKSGRLIELGLRQWSPAMEIPMAYVYGLMTVGCVLLVVNALMHAVSELLGIDTQDVGAEPLEESISIGSLSKETLP